MRTLAEETLEIKKAAISAADWNFFDRSGVSDYFGG